jgi:F0F1-type ATP synthase membrane subunit a
LAARLAGNMFSGPLLLAMLVGALVWLSQTYFNIDLPIVAVLLVYLQWLLVAVIQGFVFPLLVGIFIKMSYET